MKKLTILAILVLLTTWGCRTDNDGIQTLTDIIVTPQEITIHSGASRQLIAQTFPVNNQGVEFSWLSENPDVASVSSAGVLNAKQAGSTHIVVRGANLEKKIPVTVNHHLVISIGSAKYEIDTLGYEELGQGIKWLKFSIPEFVNGLGTLGKGLVVNSLEVDLSNTDNKIEVWSAPPSGQINRERPLAAFNRKKEEYDAQGRKPVAAINGDFYLLAADNNTGYSYINSRPLGLEVTNGMLIQTPFSRPNALIVGDDGAPHYGEISFSGSVEAGDQNYTLKEVNGFAEAGELTLFNNMANAYVTNSAFAWSPYTSTMVSLSQPENGWRVNDRIEFTVQGIEHNIDGGRDFNNGEGAVLVGNESFSSINSYTFLSNLSIGDKVGVVMNVNVGGSILTDKNINAIGYESVMLENGTTTNTWNEAHPRTGIGFSRDGSKYYLVVIDGRQIDFSVGATTGEVGDILKSLGAFTGMNLDGGGSSSITINGQVKNTPSDGSERAVANGIMITTKK
ncbi:phosphodiester glycosidase family protein [Sphingobacterium chuzhouense]|uniref:Phosphodiester glycosidase family protein n=1 Tax=Sphingobacterium chuzhouense TaxID=1742264 RepID=A0ABR7XNX9_9SPHI|nr:phosphodiester glycosidase family protein [Sphingobacterium chuzhouense]MBD1420883.1 phosphodiester glycosidase family protein [Sphingobacterium chuzhouense]